LWPRWILFLLVLADQQIIPKKHQYLKNNITLLIGNDWFIFLKNYSMVTFF
jgi:hypothetical protein